MKATSALASWVGGRDKKSSPVASFSPPGIVPFVPLSALGLPIPSWEIPAAQKQNLPVAPWTRHGNAASFIGIFLFQPLNFHSKDPASLNSEVYFC